MPPTSEQGRAPGERDPGHPAPPSGDPAAPPAPTRLRFVVGADWISPSIARSHLRRWLGALRWPQRRIDEIVLAVSEVVSNSIEHGYGITVECAEPSTGLVEVDGRLEVDDAGASRALITVADHGRWQVPDPGPSTRGRGMMLARACTDELVTEHREDGTTVIMRSRPVLAPLPD